MSSRSTINRWRKGFETKGLNPDYTDVYMEYITLLANNNAPIIFSFDHLCKLLGRSPAYLASVVNSNENHYRKFIIPKRKGGKREITAPFPALLECQHWIYNNILRKIPIHPCSHGFTNEKSIITNATIHLEQDHFLKIDIKDFFPSIGINKVITTFRNLGYTYKVSYYLSAICCYETHLPQGAPTSPSLSNIIVKNLDNRLSKFADKFQLKYSRYADDLAFSGNIPVKHIEYITNIIKEEGFLVNENKTFICKGKGKRILTGISISGSRINVPRAYKRKLRKDIHYTLAYGVESHVRKLKIRNPDYLISLLGKVNFWLQVEPQNEFACNAKKKLVLLLKEPI